LDIKSRSNGTRPGDSASDKGMETEAVLQIPEPKPKPRTGKARGLILFIAVMLMVTLCYIFLFKVVSYRDRSTDDLMWNYGYADELLRYAKNLNRYYLYYGGTDFESNMEVTEADVREYRSRTGYEVSVAESVTEEVRDYYEEAEAADEAMSQAWEYDEGSMVVTESSSIHDEYYPSDGEIYELVLIEKLQNYSNIKNYLLEQSNFQYFIYDKSSLTVYNNLSGFPSYGSVTRAELEDLAKRAYDYQSICYYSFDLSDGLFWNEYFNEMPLAESFQTAGFEGFICLPTVTPMARDLIAESERLNNYHASMLMALTISGFLLVALLVYSLTSRPGALSMGNGIMYAVYSKQPFIMKVVLAFIMLLLFADIHGSWILQSHFDNFILYAGLAFICILYEFLFLEYAFSILKNIKRLKNEPEVRFLRNMLGELKVVAALGSPVFVLLYVMDILVMVFGTCFGIVALINFISYSEFILVLLILVLWAFCFYLCLTAYRVLVNYALLSQSIYKMSQGEFRSVPYVKGHIGKPFAALSELNSGMEKAIDDAVKSQRMRAELITNVSHDLKTPLTSIINYIDLMKKSCTPNNQTQMEYIEVLEKKSQRLKVLIEDLFEAAKLTSGSAELTLAVVDIADLLKQTLGELSEKIEASGLNFRVSYGKEHCYAYVDGKKIWRLFENLIMNILKYSQPGSRVYITLDEKDELVEIVFKNISAYEITFDPEELFERFKRGDSSRSTEGSGLGLSIARRLVELHNGRMDIVVDGDLFKVIVRIDRTGPEGV